MKYFFSVFISIFCLNSYGQVWQPAMPYIPTIRQSSHDVIDELQKRILTSKHKHDTLYNICDNGDINLYATYCLINKIDYLQLFVESNNQIADKDKYQWLRGIGELLSKYEFEAKHGGFNKLNFPSLVDAFDKAMGLQLAGLPLNNLIEESPIEISKILISNFALQNNTSIIDAKNIMITKLCNQEPENTLKILSSYPNLPGADSLLIKFAYTNPQAMYDYASSTTELGAKIKSIEHPYVKLITEIANGTNGRFIFPFLDAIYLNKISIQEVQNTVDNEEKYFKLLVKAINIYEVEKQKGVELKSMPVLIDKLKAKSIETYVNTINSLHDENDLNKRFAKIQNLSPIELYYLAIMSEEEIYTSSFISGVYPKIIKDLGSIKTDSLLKMAHYGFYRKFIKMCASFNMLEDFLGKMDKPVAENLMISFANDLDSYWSLEEAVDVADSYASIKDASIKRIISKEIEKNIEERAVSKNKKGLVIYGLLQQIFSTFDSTVRPSKLAQYKIPSVTSIKVADLKNDKGRIDVQQFFYGDKDGQFIYNNFINIFRSTGWKIVDKRDWVELSVNANTPITIYCNKPLDEEKGLDDAAQLKLYKYLDSMHIYPSIVIHRGHSYYLKHTIKQITSYAQMVLLGSCGGYHSLSKVLGISPQAQIIASKQIGTGSINARIIELIFDNLKQGKDLNWVSLWQALEAKFANSKELKERFDDYIPPHKNLGALFIMSYYKAMEE